MSEEKPEQERLKVVSMSITLKYADGFKNTLETPDMVGQRPSEMSMLTPNQRPTLVTVVNIDAVKKAIQILEDSLADVKATLPTEEQVAKAKAEIAAQQAAHDRSAGPVVVPPTD